MLSVIIFYFTNNFILNYKEHFDNDNDNDKDNDNDNGNYSHIPKIIHQTAPKDKSKWDSVWEDCQKSWLNHFPKPEYEHMMWYDEDLEQLIKNDFPWFYDTYMDYDKNIKKIDIARNFILYKYGGIYADMDYMCMKNFYDKLPSNKVSICESPYKKWENVQNALMASPKEHPFWLNVVEEAKKHTKEDDVLKSTGPILLTNMCNKYPDMVNILNVKEYNPKHGTPDFDDPNVITKHFGSKIWINNL